MKVAVIVVGTELLGPDRVDTNSLAITRAFERRALSISRKTVVGDDLEDIVSVLRAAAAEFDVIVMTGGLGPTEDDLTRDAVAKAFGLELESDAGILASLKRRFADRGMEMPEVNSKQALTFRSHRTIRNPRGTAPGFHLNLDRDGRQLHLWIFPGVPTELEGMLEDDLSPWLDERFPGNEGTFRRSIHIAGMGESAVEQLMRPYYERHEGEVPTILATRNETQIHLVARGLPDHAYAELTSRENEIREIFGERVYGVDNDNLETVVGRMLVVRSATLAAAESCTGGLFGSRVTDVSGSSQYFLGSLVAYSRKAKEELLGISPKILDEHGEVSPEVAIAMAEQVRTRYGSTFGIGITGIAGPSGGTKQKPVGTVHIAVAKQDHVEHRKLMLPPPRNRVKHLSVQSALDLLRLTMLRQS